MTTDDDAAGAEATLPATPIPNVLPAGTRVGDFEITGLVGEGGFGIVYRAFDHTLHRNVALKEYMPNALARRRADLGVTLRAPQYEATFKAGLKSFVNEARLLAQFDHPALVKVFRFWEANDSAYMVMPLYEGRTLKAVLRGMPNPDEAWLKGILAPLLDALETLHGARCYHRDVAPDNILILDSGGPLLLDFGAARRIIGNMTQAVTVIIKPGYAPVEQYADDPAFTQGPWTDIYALAAVMRFAITGKPPATSVTRMVTDPVRPLAEVATGYSAGFLAALDRGLAVRPEDRPQSIAEFRKLLGLEGYGISQPRSMPLPQIPTAPPPSTAASAAPSTAASIAPAAPATSPAAPAGTPGGPILGTGTHTVPFRASSGELPPASFPGAAAAEPSVPVPSAPPPAVDAQEPKRAAPFAASTPRPPSAAIATSASVPWTPILVVAGALAAVIAGGYFIMQSLAPKPTGVGARIRAESAPTAPAPAMAPAATAGAATGAPAGAPPTSSSAAPAQGLPAAAAPVEPPTPRAEPVPVPPVAAPAAPPATAAPAPVSPVVVPPAPSPGAAGSTALTPPPPRAAPAAPSGTGAPAATPAAPPTGRLVLNVKPWGEVFVDGRSRGPSPPLKTLVLPEGKHRIEVRNPAATAALVQDVEIKAGRNVSLTHAFK